MRRARRGSHSVLEFGGSGEDSFVAVVVTKLTGALLFILLLAMVIMALIPRSETTQVASSNPARKAPLLAITTPTALPEAIAGRPYSLALAAQGGGGTLEWVLDGPLPEGLRFRPESATIEGVPTKGTSEPIALVARVSDNSHHDTRALSLVVYQPESRLGLPVTDLSALPKLAWKTWLEHGFGFLLLLLVHQIGLQTTYGLQRRALTVASDLGATLSTRRFVVYRMVLHLTTAIAMLGLAAWLGSHLLV